MSSQENLVYAPMATKHRDVSVSRLLCFDPTSSKSFKFSVAVSKLSYIDIIFILNLTLKSTRSITEKFC